jgi:hypothetical protein
MASSEDDREAVNRAHHGIGAWIEHFARIERICPNGHAILPLCALDNSGGG